MILKNKKGQEIEIYFQGTEPDDIECSSASFVNCDEQVLDDDIDWIMTIYTDDIFTDWMENQVARAENYFEGDR